LIHSLLEELFRLVVFRGIGRLFNLQILKIRIKTLGFMVGARVWAKKSRMLQWHPALNNEP
jgi:hypothetical protein